MNETWILLRPRDGLTLKDPRGFRPGAGLAARSLRWPLPPTLSGAIRTAIGWNQGFRSHGDSQRWQGLLQDVSVAGPLPVWRSNPLAPWQALWPVPRDAQWGNDCWQYLNPTAPSQAGPAHARSIRTSDDDRSLAIESLWRPTLTVSGKATGDPPRYWTERQLLRWMLNPYAKVTREPLPGIPVRTDVHIRVDPSTKTAADGALFSKETVECLLDGRSAGGSLGAELAILTRIHAAHAVPTATYYRFGGEQRLCWAEMLSQSPFACPRELLDKWIPSPWFRLILVTPAVFATGFYPDFLSVEKPGGKPCLAGVLPGLGQRVRLCAVLVDRALPISGWDFATQMPKASRRAVAAGAVYFFQAERDLQRDDIRALWLSCIQRPGQDQRDGFGIVVPAAWPCSNTLEENRC